MSFQLQTWQNMARKFHPKISTARAIWMTSYKDAEWELFYELSQKNCNYCGRPPHRTWNVAALDPKHTSHYQKTDGYFTYNGLDRIDNRIGHTATNIVPCCTDCNIMKSNKTVANFLAHIQKIYIFRSMADK